MNHWIETSGTLDLWQVGVAWLLLAGCLTAGALALWESVRSARSVTDPRLRYAMAAVVVLGAALRLWVDGRMTTVFIGYKATQQAIELFPVPHYGAGASALYHNLLRAFGPDHRVILTANAIMGALTLPLVMTWVRRMTRSAPAALAVGVLVALGPLFIRNDASDANNVPALLWTFCGLVLLARALEDRDRWPLWWSGFAFALATVSRPEWIVLVCGLLLTTAVAHPARPPLRRLLQDAALLLPFAALTIPHFIGVRRAAAAMHRGGNMESLDRMLGFEHVIQLDPSLFSPALTALALASVALLWRSHTRWVASLALTSVLMVMVYAVDLDRANLARAHVPTALLTTILAGHALSVAIARFAPPRHAAPAWALALLAVLATNVPAAQTLWQPTLEAEEERLIRDALAAIDAPDATLVRLNHPDTDRARLARVGHTHYHFPDYLLVNETRRGRALPLTAWLADPDQPTPGPVYFLRSVRCYAEFRPEDAPPPAGANEHSLCRSVLELPGVQPVFERTVPNHGDVWINYFGTAETLTLGLYRLR